MVPVERPAGSASALVLIDATSGAGGLPVDAGQADAYYFAPQKAFAADGGLWLALLSPAAIERIEQLDGADDGRWQPAFLSLALGARELAQGADLQHARAGDAAPARRPDRVDARRRRARLRCRRGAAPRRSTSTAGRRRSDVATPFVADPAKRSLVVGTIDFDESVDAAALAAHAAVERHRRRRALPQARPQPAARSACSRRSTRPTSRRSPPASTGCWRTPRREAMTTARSWSRRRSPTPASSCCASASTSSSASNGGRRARASGSASSTAILIRSATKLTADLIERAERLR